MEKLLRVLERKFGRYAIHNIAIVLLAPQVAFFIWGALRPMEEYIESYLRLTLYPAAILDGEWWRTLSFLVLPPTRNPLLFLCYVLLFPMFCAGLERQWGIARLNIYLFSNWLFIVVASFIAALTLDGRAQHMRGADDMYTSVFLGFATLFPNFVLNLFGVLPVKVKWLGWIAFLTVVYRFGQGEWDQPADYAHRVIILGAMANYLLFFGPALVRGQAQKQAASSRRREFEEAMRRGHEERERALREEGQDGPDAREERRDPAPPTDDEHERGFRRD